MTSKPFKLLMASEQVAAHLQENIHSGYLRDEMPGVLALAEELGVNPSTVVQAYQLLEQGGTIVSMGKGKPRRIVVSNDSSRSQQRITIILFERDDLMNRTVTELRHQLLKSGHGLNIAPKTLVELNHNPKRVAHMVASVPADMWIVQAASRPVLQWFADAKIPALALFGRMRGIPIAGAGPDKVPALRDGVRHLIAQGHRRIVFLVREERRKPNIGTAEQVVLDELKAHGIKTGTYNLPDWEESPEGLSRCLDDLFRHTPPTAFLVGEWMLFLAVQYYLGWVSSGQAKKIAMICSDYNPALKWCHPPIAHIEWDHRAVAREVVHWINKAALGKVGRKQRLTKATFVPSSDPSPSHG